MILARTINQARASRQFLGTMALVPTMGALHEGHLSLIRIAKEHAPSVVVSIFVNPMQFGPREDFSRYPRPIEADLEKCQAAGVDLVFNPTAEEMYPGMKFNPGGVAPAVEPVVAGEKVDATMVEADVEERRTPSPVETVQDVHSIDFSTIPIEEPIAPRPPGPEPVISLVSADGASANPPADLGIDIPSLTTVLEGKLRPGHFKGVLQVVAKLFNVLTPEFACFGQKDFQQLRVITAMVEALNFPVKIVGCPTVRDPDGLAKSSRNQYLSAPDRKRALAISRALLGAAREVANGSTQLNRLTAFMQRTLAEQRLQIDYIAAIDPITLKAVTAIRGRTVFAVAARVGQTRLIDNVIVEPPEGATAS